MATKTQKLDEMLNRLRNGKLTSSDTAAIAKLIERARADTSGRSVSGRPIIARLPHGMDVVK